MTKKDIVILSQTQLDEMKAKIDAMEDALSFYANEENYSSFLEGVLNDEGSKARSALGIENE